MRSPEVLDGITPPPCMADSLVSQTESEPKPIKSTKMFVVSLVRYGSGISTIFSGSYVDTYSYALRGEKCFPVVMLEAPDGKEKQQRIFLRKQKVVLWECNYNVIFKHTEQLSRKIPNTVHLRNKYSGFFVHHLRFYNLLCWCISVSFLSTRLNLLISITH